MTLLPSAEDDTFVRKLTKSRPLFFARRLAADSPRARSAAPRRRGRPRGREREHNAATAAADRVLPGRERPDGNWEGRREERRKEREKKEDLWHCCCCGGGGGRRGKRSSIILASTDGGSERGTRCTGGGSMQHGGTRRPTDRRPRWQQSCAARRSFCASLLRGRTYVLLRVRCRRRDRSKTAPNLRNWNTGEYTSQSSWNHLMKWEIGT